ncbi:hypothetical protein CTI14_72470, partial [Methylobacterium radiotolerans]
SRAESIRKFTILDSEWTEASGHLTPKLSIKRNIMSRAESIRKFTILDSEWTEASGHLTPKLSIKRN